MAEAYQPAPLEQVAVEVVPPYVSLTINLERGGQVRILATEKGCAPRRPPLQAPPARLRQAGCRAGPPPAPSSG